MAQDATWYGDSLGPGQHCVRCGPSSSSPKRGQGPRPANSWPMSIVAKRLYGSRCHWHGGRPRPRPHCARWGPSFPSPKRGHSLPQISAHVCCGQTAGWIKICHLVKVDLDRGHIVTWGPSSPLPKGHSPTIFGPCLLWPNGRPSQLLLITCLTGSPCSCEYNLRGHSSCRNNEPVLT